MVAEHCQPSDGAAGVKPIAHMRLVLAELNKLGPLLVKLKVGA